MATAVLKTEFNEAFENLLTFSEQLSSTFWGCKKDTASHFFTHMITHPEHFVFFNDPPAVSVLTLSHRLNYSSLNESSLKKRYSAQFNISLEILQLNLEQKPKMESDNSSKVKTTKKFLLDHLFSLNIDFLNDQSDWQRFKTITRAAVKKDSTYATVGNLCCIATVP